MEYLGEQLIYGRIGNLLIAVSFAAALLAVCAYLFNMKRPEDAAWRRVGRISFGLHAVSVISIFGVLYYLIVNHRFEYYYVWQHSSTILPLRYIMSCFWEGQEGSFLLWTFWHVVLAVFILRRGGTWEPPVMAVIMMVQVFLCSMVLGVYLGDFRIGSNPFVLLREHPEMANLPFASMPDYLDRIEDGRGLNPLLQNYWMVIHPPVLFLGFAATLMPFAFAVGGLLSGRVTEWIRPALGWAYFGVMALGMGILMGAAWAYEALSFGGFWAWDPVENASLVPWLTLVGAAHVMIIQKRNQESLLSSYLLCVITFILVLYSTFLTRSGILGDTSVHAFTDLGMSGQLLVYMGFFVLLAVVLLIRHRKSVIRRNPEEHATSREFWMFVGMLVLAISATQITFTTSLPVINKIFGTNMAPPAEPVEFYNSIQVPVAVIICMLVGIGQFFKYKRSDVRKVMQSLVVSAAASVIITVAVAWAMGFTRIHYIALLFASIFSVTANADYLFRVLRGRLRHSGASIAHVGIGLILLGTLVSNARSNIISNNVLNIDLGEDFPNNENIMLVRNDTLRMADYYVTYREKRREGVNIFYTIDYLERREDGTYEKAFTLEPRVQLNARMGNVAEPDTRHFPDRDIYTHVTYADLETGGLDDDRAYQEPREWTVRLGDTIINSNSVMVLRSLNKSPDTTRWTVSGSDIAVSALLQVSDVNMKGYTAEPVFVIRNNIAFTIEDVLDELGLKIGFTRIDPGTEQFTITVAEKKGNKKDFIIMKAIVFPYINILWTGCIFMIIGTAMAARRRFRQARQD